MRKEDEYLRSENHSNNSRNRKKKVGNENKIEKTLCLFSLFTYMKESKILYF